MTCPHRKCGGVLVKVVRIDHKNLLCDFYFIQYFSCGHTRNIAGGKYELCL